MFASRIKSGAGTAGRAIQGASTLSARPYSCGWADSRACSSSAPASCAASCGSLRESASCRAKPSRAREDPPGNSATTKLGSAGRNGGVPPAVDAAAVADTASADTATASRAESIILQANTVDAIRRTGKWRIQIRKYRQIGVGRIDPSGCLRMDCVRTRRTRAVGIRHAVVGIGGLRSTVADGSAQGTLSDPQRNVDYVIVGTTTIGKTC